MEAFYVDLLEAGALTLALAAFLKDINGVGKTGVVNPGHLFGQVRVTIEFLLLVHLIRYLLL